MLHSIARKCRSTFPDDIPFISDQDFKARRSRSLPPATGPLPCEVTSTSSCDSLTSPVPRAWVLFQISPRPCILTCCQPSAGFSSRRRWHLSEVLQVFWTPCFKWFTSIFSSPRIMFALHSSGPPVYIKPQARSAHNLFPLSEKIRIPWPRTGEIDVSYWLAKPPKTGINSNTTWTARHAATTKSLPWYARYSYMIG